MPEPTTARRRARSVLPSAAAVAALALSGCGGSSADDTTRATLTPDPTGIPTQPASTPQAAAAPAFTPVSTYGITWSSRNGFEYRASFSFGTLAHADPAHVSPCDANPQTDAEVPYRAELTNDTAQFDGAPGLSVLVASEDLDPIPVSGGSECRDRNSSGSPGFYLGSKSLAPSASVTRSGYVVVPNYYAPDAPDGNDALLETIQLKPQPLDGYRAIELTGPGISNTLGLAHLSDALNAGPDGTYTGQ